jgi:hypothetical protein
MTEHGLGPPIYVYTQEQALADGILEDVSTLGFMKVVATSNLSHRIGLDNRDTVNLVLHDVARALMQPDEEDDEYRKLRVLHWEGVKYWAIQEPSGVTLLLPEDY